MNCRGWEERIATAARDGAPDAALYQHLVGCSHCLQFARQIAAVAGSLTKWEVPAAADQATEATRAALVERLAAIRQPPLEQSTRRRAVPIAEQPAVFAVAGAVSMAAGVITAPGWIQWALVCWAAITVLAVTLVLLHHGRADTSEGEC